jgi:desulfoferrodoxin (superoxide reductase-like protein)
VRLGHMRRIKILVCPECGAIFTGTGNAEFSCCGRKLEPLKAQKSDSEHTLNIERADGGIYLTFDHGMTKEHHIAFIAYVNCDRVLLVRLYPEQSPEVLLPALYGGRYYFYCTKHGLFVK